MTGRPSAEQTLHVLLAQYGPQQWWPGDSAFEIMLGAVLVQRTSWTNASAAIEGLRSRGWLDYERLGKVSEADLRTVIRPAGFFRLKANRLKNLVRFIAGSGGIRALQSMPAGELRRALLAVNGIGPETADAIMLYAFEHSAAVVDDYLRRILRRLHSTNVNRTDATIRTWVLQDIKSPAELNEFHALIVTHGKHTCGQSPKCPRCDLASYCDWADAYSSDHPKPDSRR